ncbi:MULTISPECIES: glycosyltransferase [unclassified Pseudodesulfovibrio]|uniref:glycosyltransferase n=1 Tax=unclassified Pseudodesulfovibrio TaxID=2661612 RepID=UPI001F4F96A3|nr:MULTISPECIES: glycosyltransferase [unclassified Pseudodesulfovibrio]MCJ2163802.1 glycosyltransferase [Pseudodesulfovibrio sp. S3-i]
MKRVCFFNTSKAWGGGEQWVFENSRIASRNGYVVHVVANEESVLGDRLEGLENIIVHRFPVTNLSFLNPLMMVRLMILFIRNAINSVIISLPNDVKIGGMAARCVGVRNIIYRRGIAVPVRNSAFNRFLFKSIITRMVCNSSETRRLVLKENPELIDPSNVNIIYNGFDFDSYDERPSAPIYQRLGKEIVIGNVGRLTRQKGQHLVIEAVRILEERGHDVRLLLAGTGELETELKEYARSRGLGKTIFFLGFVKEMKGFYQSIDILAHSALWEGFGYALVEAQATRKPVVAFDVSSNPEVIENGFTGVLATPEDVTDFADKIESLILSPERRIELGNNGRKRVVAKFGSEHAFKKLAELIDS